MRTLVGGFVTKPGVHDAIWNARSEAREYVPTGVYFFKMKAGKSDSVRKVKVIGCAFALRR